MKNEERFMVMIQLDPKSKYLVFHHFSLFTFNFSFFIIHYLLVKIQI